MSNAIAPIAGLQGTEPVVPAATRAVDKPSGTAFTPADTTTTQPTLHPNPSFEIDMALGLVVMEFRNGSGAVSSTIPTSQQLEAYRRSAGHAATHAAAGATAQAATPAPTGAPSGEPAAATPETAAAAAAHPAAATGHVSSPSATA